MTHDLARHLSMERLAAYRAGELAPEEAEAVQDHLAECRECVSALLDLARYGEMMELDEPLPPGAGVPTSAQTEASWQSLRARLPSAPAVSPAVPPAAELPGTLAPVAQVIPFGRASRASNTAGRPVLVSALAAALALCLVGFPLWIATHRAAPLGLAVPGAEVRRGADGPMPPLTVHLGGGMSILAVPLPEREPFPAYRVEIRSLQGALLSMATTAPAAVASPVAGGSASAQVVTIVLPAASLPIGEYRLRLVGVHGEAGEVLAEHALRVEP
jgi:Putative zinc-finger